MINSDSAAEKKIQPINKFLNVIGTPEDNFSAFIVMKKLKICGICLSLNPPFGPLFTKSAKIRLHKSPASQIFIRPCGRTVGRWQHHVLTQCKRSNFFFDSA